MYVSIKWKITLIFVLILLTTMTITNLFVSSSMSEYYINQRRVSQLTTANIIATTIANNVDNSAYNVREMLGYYIPRMDSRIIYTDATGKVLVDSVQESTMEGTVLSHFEVSQALQGINEHGIHNLPQSGWVMYVAVPIIQEGDVVGTVFTSSPISDVKQAVGYIRTLMLSISVISGVIVIILSFLLANSLVKPIDKLTKISKRMSKGELNSRVEINSNDEIGALGESFNSMAAQLEKIETNRLRFLGDISHDLKTPLATIKVLTEALEGETNIDVYHEFHGDIISEVDRMTSMVNNILQLNKISNINVPLKKSDFIFAEVVSHSLMSICKIAENKNIKVSFEDFSHREHFYADREKIKAMTLNIMENAVKYTQEGGLVNISLRKEESYYILEIEDNGKGIPQEDIGYIFDRFYRVDKTRHRETGGSGIGLSIVKTVVDLHKGRIEVESEEGVGTKFTVSLPKLRY